MTKKYIDVDDVLEQLFYLYDSISPNTLTGNDARIKILQSYKTIENLPAADVQEVRHGEWMYNDLYFLSCAECSECGWKSSVDGEEIPSYHYCPCCGARMDGEENG